MRLSENELEDTAANTYCSFVTVNKSPEKTKTNIAMHLIETPTLSVNLSPKDIGSY